MTALTTTEKQRNRRRRLNEAAQAMGYHTWGKYETAVLKYFDDLNKLGHSSDHPHPNCKCQVVPLSRP